MTTHTSEKIRHVLAAQENTALSQDLLEILAEQKFAGFLPRFVVSHICEKHHLTKNQLALWLLPVAACYATTPISRFNVGAVVQGEQGDFYFGANQEFANCHIQQSIHAEQSAISHAWMRGETKITDITVNYTPCGHCRQFMNELNSAQSLHIHLPHSQNNPLQHYLPDSFGPVDLEIESRLLDKTNNQLVFESNDNLIQQAFLMANQTHAPYSHSYHGVAIQTREGNIYTGSYAENAAFNPSLPAMQVAINHLILSGDDIENICRVAMVEKTGDVSNRKMAEELLSVISNVKLEYTEL